MPGPSDRFWESKRETKRLYWESIIAIDAVSRNERSKIHHYKVEERTVLGEKEIVKLTAVDDKDAEDMALSLIMKGAVELKGRGSTYNVVVDEE